MKLKFIQRKQREKEGGGGGGKGGGGVQEKDNIAQFPGSPTLLSSLLQYLEQYLF